MRYGLLFFLMATFGATLQASYLYAEKDGGSQILYKADCTAKGSEGVCSLTAVTVSGKDSKFPCKVVADVLFHEYPAQVPNSATFIITSTAGACEYTNTYIFAPDGMTQTKTSPAKIPAGLDKVCNKLPPKSYQAKRVQGDIFTEVPADGCSSFSVLID